MSDTVTTRVHSGQGERPANNCRSRRRILRCPTSQSHCDKLHNTTHYCEETGTLAVGIAQTTFGGEEPFPADLRDAYLARARLMKIRRGQVIISEGSETSDVYLIRSGRVQVSLFSP